MIKRVKYLVSDLMVVALFTCSSAFAADDASIKGETRSKIQSAMSEMIDRNTVNNVYSHFDPIKGELHNLDLVELHDGIVKKGNYYVSCADFRNSKGKMLDIDFLVLEKDDGFVATQAVIHKADNKKRKYHLEN
ncbi:MAG: hypothetical protein KZQ94_17840 [Candidatus Thiodiazotropha sp. (ex Troendleina suluensis)]|nr:hypothetical protein [Candidatus Thiodiazotropha sp. (ex Troendleina suluensis)]